MHDKVINFPKKAWLMVVADVSQHASRIEALVECEKASNISVWHGNYFISFNFLSLCF